MASRPDNAQPTPVPGTTAQDDLNSTVHQEGSLDINEPDINGPDINGLDRLAQTAYDIQELQDRLVTLSSVELRQVPILQDGADLRPDEVYINLNDAKRREFSGAEGMTVKPGTYIVPKDDVAYDLWNRLTNVG